MSDGMRRELAYLSSHATNRYFIPNWGNLMQLDAYRWHGLGQSILDPRKQGVAVGSVMNVEGTGSDKEVERLKEAHTVSDYMLRYDWLKRLD